MGIKKLPWKKIVAIVLSFLFVLSAIISIVKGWDVILNCLRYLGNLILEILKFLINPIVRDVLLFVLISGALRWLFLVNKKLKKLLIASEEGKKAVPKEKPKEDKEFEWTENHNLILTKIARGGDTGENTHCLFDTFKKKLPDAEFLDLQVIIDELMKAGLISIWGAWDAEAKSYVATEKGRKNAKKILEKARRTKEK
jgi:hypothetical protein